MKKITAIIATIAIFTVIPAFGASVCVTNGSIVANCGFENGVYTSTIGGNTNTQVPVSWTPNAAFDLEAAFNHLTAPGNSGVYGLSIGNYLYQPTATLSQTLATVASTSYTGSIYVYYPYGESTAFLDVDINGVPVLSLTGALDTTSAYTEYTFGFTGSGSDVLSIGAGTDPGEWFVDDVTVNGGSTPEPSSLLLLLTASGPVYALKRRFAKR